LTRRGKKLLPWTGEAVWGRYKIKCENLLRIRIQHEKQNRKNILESDGLETQVSSLPNSGCCLLVLYSFFILDSDY
jgi:hypothetical protein